jgi:hypothetical protein
LSNPIIPHDEEILALGYELNPVYAVAGIDLHGRKARPAHLLPDLSHEMHHELEVI